MTPLAQRIVREMTLPIKDRTFRDQCDLMGRMDDVHCFEVTEVMPLAEELAESMRKYGVSGKLTFLPAPKTWIECRDCDGFRRAVLICGDGDAATVRSAWEHGSDEGRWSLPLTEINPGRQFRRVILDHAEKPTFGFRPEIIYALLAVINTPRLIGRKQHMPHKGLERKLVNAKGLVGKFPLHAWTELKLSVSAMMRQADGTEHEAHLTGERCLHFCRAHIRVKSGRIEQVKAHWRGNPALGIKRTRYKLAA